MKNPIIVVLIVVVLGVVGYLVWQKMKPAEKPASLAAAPPIVQAMAYGLSPFSFV